MFYFMNKRDLFDLITQQIHLTLVTVTKLKSVLLNNDYLKLS